ncbi:MAG: hypothetical protein ACYCYL_11005, partial [Acidithiobacillus sp.]
GSACPPGKKTSRVSATDAVVVERFEIAISNIKELQDWLSNSGAPVEEEIAGAILGEQLKEIVLRNPQAVHHRLMNAMCNRLLLLRGCSSFYCNTCKWHITSVI